MITVSFVSGCFVALISHYLAERRRMKEEEERIKDFKERILRQLKRNAYVLSKKEIGKYINQTEDLIDSLEFGDASTFYYKIPKEEREEIDIVLDLLFDEKYNEAKDKLGSLVTQ